VNHRRAEVDIFRQFVSHIKHSFTKEGGPSIWQQHYARDNEYWSEFLRAGCPSNSIIALKY